MTLMAGFAYVGFLAFHDTRPIASSCTISLGVGTRCYGTAGCVMAPWRIRRFLCTSGSKNGFLELWYPEINSDTTAVNSYSIQFTLQTAFIHMFSGEYRYLRLFTEPKSHIRSIITTFAAFHIIEFHSHLSFTSMLNRRFIMPTRTATRFLSLYFLQILSPITSPITCFVLLCIYIAFLPAALSRSLFA